MDVEFYYENLFKCGFSENKLMGVFVESLCWEISIAWRNSCRNYSLLIPVFPRLQKYEDFYMHALDRDALTTEIEGLKRIDRQLISMIDDARERMKQKGLVLNEKVLMAGFSASGMFVNRLLKTAGAQSFQ